MTKTKVQFAEPGKLLDHAARFTMYGVGTKVTPRRDSLGNMGRVGVITRIESDPEEVLGFTVEFAEGETPVHYSLRNLGIVGYHQAAVR